MPGASVTVIEITDGFPPLIKAVRTAHALSLLNVGTCGYILFCDMFKRLTTVLELIDQILARAERMERAERAEHAERVQMDAEEQLLVELKQRRAELNPESDGDVVPCELDKSEGNALAVLNGPESDAKSSDKDGMPFDESENECEGSPSREPETRFVIIAEQTANLNGEEHDDHELSGSCSTVIQATAEVGQGLSEIIHAMQAELDALQARMDARDAAHPRAPALAPKDLFQATVPVPVDHVHAQEQIIVPTIAGENADALPNAESDDERDLPEADPSRENLAEEENVEPLRSAISLANGPPPNSPTSPKSNSSRRKTLPKPESPCSVTDAKELEKEFDSAASCKTARLFDDGDDDAPEPIIVPTIAKENSTFPSRENLVEEKVGDCGDEAHKPIIGSVIAGEKGAFSATAACDTALRKTEVDKQDPSTFVSHKGVSLTADTVSHEDVAPEPNELPAHKDGAPAPDPPKVGVISVPASDGMPGCVPGDVPTIAEKNGAFRVKPEKVDLLDTLDGTDALSSIRVDVRLRFEQAKLRFMVDGGKALNLDDTELHYAREDTGDIATSLMRGCGGKAREPIIGLTIVEEKDALPVTAACDTAPRKADVDKHDPSMLKADDACDVVTCPTTDLLRPATKAQVKSQVKSQLLMHEAKADDDVHEAKADDDAQEDVAPEPNELPARKDSAHAPEPVKDRVPAPEPVKDGAPAPEPIKASVIGDVPDVELELPKADDAHEVKASVIGDVPGNMPDVEFELPKADDVELGLPKADDDVHEAKADDDAHDKRGSPAIISPPGNAFETALPKADDVGDVVTCPRAKADATGNDSHDERRPTAVLGIDGDGEKEKPKADDAGDVVTCPTGEFYLVLLDSVSSLTDRPRPPLTRGGVCPGLSRFPVCPHRCVVTPCCERGGVGETRLVVQGFGGRIIVPG